VLRAALLVLAAAVLPAVHAQEQVTFVSLDTAGGKPVRLLGHWFAAPASEASAPAFVLLAGGGRACRR
jgi:hypothetical protein